MIFHIVCMNYFITIRLVCRSSLRGGPGCIIRTRLGLFGKFLCLVRGGWGWEEGLVKGVRGFFFGGGLMRVDWGLFRICRELMIIFTLEYKANSFLYCYFIYPTQPMLNSFFPPFLLPRQNSHKFDTCYPLLQ